MFLFLYFEFMENIRLRDINQLNIEFIWTEALPNDVLCRSVAHHIHTTMYAQSISEWISSNKRRAQKKKKSQEFLRIFSS